MYCATYFSFLGVRWSHTDDTEVSKTHKNSCAKYDTLDFNVLIQVWHQKIFWKHNKRILIKIRVYVHEL